MTSTNTTLIKVEGSGCLAWRRKGGVGAGSLEIFSLYLKEYNSSIWESSSRGRGGGLEDFARDL